MTELNGPQRPSSSPPQPGRTTPPREAAGGGFLVAAAAVHTRQKRWAVWGRVAWWLLLLPVALFCWASGLGAGWPRRLGIGLAALVAIAGLGGVLADDEPSPASSDSAQSDVDDVVDAVSTSGPESEATSTTTSSTTSTTTPSTTSPPTTTANQMESADEAIAAVGTDGGPSASAGAALLSALEGLVGDPDPSRPQYDRDAFFERDDLDGDCVDSRHEVLQEEAVEYVMSVNGCSVTAGTWWDPFSGQWFTDPADLQLDHVVALGDAWRSGAWAWSDNDRRLFANHPANLNAIHGPENQAKSDDGPAGYSPTNEAQRCAYLVQYAAVKAAWRLTIAQGDYSAIVAGFAACDSAAPASPTAPPATPTPEAPVTTIAVLPFVPPANPQPAAGSGDCHPAYSPCLPNLAGNAINCGDLTSAQKPVTVRTIGVDPYALDGNSDGVGCESG